MIEHFRVMPDATPVEKSTRLSQTQCLGFKTDLGEKQSLQRVSGQSPYYFDFSQLNCSLDILKKSLSNKMISEYIHDMTQHACKH